MSQPDSSPALRPDQRALVDLWRSPLQDLCAAIRGAVRGALAEAIAASDGLDRVSRAVGAGAGDITFAIDVVAEDAVDAWFEAVSSSGPLSLMTEDAGWRHRGPAPDGAGSIELEGFHHGGPRIALDPIDGTRNLMHDLRSAWVVVSFAGAVDRVERDAGSSMVEPLQLDGASAVRG
ncbi:MAG: hypothetical protein AAGG01_24080, partial [Planctomycetota bacterium]